MIQSDLKDRTMSESHSRGIASGDMRGPQASSNWTFWLTLIVTTFLVALTAYVLSGAFFEPASNASGRRPATERSRSTEFGVFHDDRRGTLAL